MTPDPSPILHFKMRMKYEDEYIISTDIYDMQPSYKYKYYLHKSITATIKWPGGFMGF